MSSTSPLNAQSICLHQPSTHSQSNHPPRLQQTGKFITSPTNTPCLIHSQNEFYSRRCLAILLESLRSLHSAAAPVSAAFLKITVERSTCVCRPSFWSSDLSPLLSLLLPPSSLFSTCPAPSICTPPVSSCIRKLVRTAPPLPRQPRLRLQRSAPRVAPPRARRVLQPAGAQVLRQPLRARPRVRTRLQLLPSCLGQP